MRVFVSSVRRGLEAERDALPGLIAAIGHEPVRFEDFGASSIPSREACLRGVASADVYVLLIGPHYGHRFDDTGQSATHDEWIAATRKGMPRFVFVKTGVEMEDDQREFLTSISDYGTGIFRDTFDTAVDLQPKVVSALRTYESAPSPLEYSPLTDPVDIEWRNDRNSRAQVGAERPMLELHVLPLPLRGLSSRQMHDLSTAMAGRIRRAGLVADDFGLNVSRISNVIVVDFPSSDRRSWNEPHLAAPTGVRVYQSGQVSVYAHLPGDGLGTILDQDELPTQISSILRAIEQLGVVTSKNLAIAVGVDPGSPIGLGSVAKLPRSQASFGLGSREALRIPPDESMTSAALGTGADEVASSLTRSLIDAIR